MPTSMTDGMHEWRERLADYHSELRSDGSDFPEEERRAVEAHLAECAECRAALATYDRLYALARSPLHLDAPATESAEGDQESNNGREAPRPAPLPYRRLLPHRLLSFGSSSPAATSARSALLAALAAALILAGFAALLLPRLRGEPGTAIPSSALDPYIYGMAMASADEGWAGGNGRLWHYHDGHWGYVPYPLVDSGGGATYFGQPGEPLDIQMLTPDDGWSASGQLIFHFDGSHWSIAQGVPMGSADILRGISMSSADDGWTVGYQLGGAPVALHYSHGAWTRVPVPFDGSLELWRVTAVSTGEAWASGYGAPSASAPNASVPPVLMHYTGGHWQQASVPAGLSSLGTVVMLGPSDGWMPAYRYSGFGDPTSGVLLRYRNGSWQIARELGNASWIEQIAFSSPTEGWAVGSILLHFHDGVWSVVELPAGAAGAHLNLNAISLVSADEGWAGGFGVLLHLHQGQWSLYGKMNPPGPERPGPIPTPTLSPPCATPSSSTDAIQSGGLGADFLTLPQRWGTEHFAAGAQGGGEYLGAYQDTGEPRAFVENDNIAVDAVPSLVYLVDSTQYLTLDQARAIAAGIIPRDANPAAPPGDAAIAVDGTADTYCSAAFAYLMQQTPQHWLYVPVTPGLFTVSYVSREGGGVDRIVFAPTGSV